MDLLLSLAVDGKGMSEVSFSNGLLILESGAFIVIISSVMARVVLTQYGRSIKFLLASPAQSFLASFSSRSMKCTRFEMGPPLLRRRGRCFYVGATSVAP
jgi:hypothetical protein